ncbi:helix-turn-helix transcriptional regulator [Microbulbifer sp. OS29]|uniref:Helix-turn-helix transcriptional regulator n=1 Tax=Microbulbifer okhotskensis TaxID=2926617 RepID=A0A9X2J3W2_9GAMM|nr:helix-turn-helix domain-containing protein [Microbulbifer okhotskensis]MCO1333478.1 helix-turn-helix transcriptional regulator [Microbulbifer okhotskensis]
MSRKRFDDLDCSLACALNEVGDWWSLLLIKQAMLGTRRFVDFQRNLGIAKNILVDRLCRLVESGVLARVDAGEHGTRYEYRLTEKGRDLFTVVIALRQWNLRWNGNRDGMRLLDKSSGEPISEVAVQNSEGEPLTIKDVLFVDENGQPLEQAG